MNSSYESFDFAGGWQDDQFVGTPGSLDVPFSNPTDARLNSIGNLQGNCAVSSPDEWLSVQSAWLQQNNTYNGSTSFDFDSFHALPTYTTVRGSPYGADLIDVSDFDQCQSHSSFSETDFESFQPTHYHGTTYRTNSFSSLPLASPTSDPSYQQAANAYIVQAHSPSPLPYDNHHHTRPTPVHYTNITNAPPSKDLLPSDPLYPRQQPSRFEGDLYTPTFVRGDGPTRAGWCSQCSSWLTLKDSAYWYHMHFVHGISCATGKHLPVPVRCRPTAGAARGVGDAEALCGGCGRWVLIVTGEKGRTAWWRHAYRCKFKDGEVGKERKRGKSVSPRKVVARPMGDRN
jgi:hypothetical protein